MSLIQKLKDILGIGGVQIQFKVSKELSRKATSLTGKVIVTAKSQQEISSIDIDLKEVWQVSNGNSIDVEDFEIGETRIDTASIIKPGETKEFAFTLQYELLKSKNDRLQDQGGPGKALGTLGKFIDREKSNFWLNASANIKGAVFGPTASLELILTNN